MNRYHHSKSGLFLMELLINLLLFCVLCSCSLTFFLKSHQLTEDSKTLQHAASMTSSVASLYESGDGSLICLCDVYEQAELIENICYVYFDENYLPCQKEAAIYIIQAKPAGAAPDSIQITFYKKDGEAVYSIPVCHYSPHTLGTAKEVHIP